MSNMKAGGVIELLEAFKDDEPFCEVLSVLEFML